MYMFHILSDREALDSSTLNPEPTAMSNSLVLSLGSSPTTTPSSVAATGGPDPTGTSTPLGSSTLSTVTPIIIILVSLIGLVSFAVLLRHLRRKHKNPKYIPTEFLKRRWERWTPSDSSSRLPQTSDHLEPVSRRTGPPPASFDVTAGGAVSSNGGAAVDRNHSVRSVMTLPAYHPNPLQNEQVLGREGDRGGIDVVLEFPEGADEEEAHREEEMEALYQIRLARRRENEEREERRRLRREARERGDWVALREINERARQSSTASAGRSIAELRAEHDRLKRERQRNVSSVSYGDLGVARHDGTRLRANSQESERQGLLGDAASISASSNYHRRGMSSASTISIDTMNSDLPNETRSRANSNARPESPLGRISTAGQGNVTNHSDRAGSSPEIIDQDDDIPPNSPPGYENISLDTPHDEHPQPLQEAPPGYSNPGEEGFAIESSNRRETIHVGRLVVEDRRQSRDRRSSSGSSRGVGGVPQLPSLRLASLPSIVLESASPASAVRPQRDEENDYSTGP